MDFLRGPAGLGVYWIISNILMAVQTYLLNKFVNPKELAEKARKGSRGAQGGRTAGENRGEETRA